MDLKEVLAKVKAAVGEELTPKIEGLLKSIESEYNSIADDLKAANAESKERKLKIRELTGQLEDVQGKAKDLEGKVNNPDQAKELADLKQFKADVLKTRRVSFASEFAPVLKHQNFEKAKGNFKLPQPSESGEYDLSKLTDADIEHNMAKLAEYRAIGLLADAAAAAPAPAGFNAPTRTGAAEPPKITNPSELGAYIGTQLSRYK